jgi:hypothetical protein
LILTTAGMPSGWMSWTESSSAPLMVPRARNLIGHAEVEPQVNGWLDQRAARLTG